MLNPFGSEQDLSPSSYVNLQKRMLQKVQSAKVSDQIFIIIQNAFENALQKENVVLSRTERKRLFSQILKSVLQDMVNKLENSTKN